MTEDRKQPVSGVPANKLLIPIVLVLAILHVIVILLSLRISAASSGLGEVKQNGGVYTQEATSLLAGSSVLSETSCNFVLLPVTESGEINVNSLYPFAQELLVDRRGPEVLARFMEHDVPEKAKEFLAVAAESAQNMLDAQLHAIALICTIYDVPQLPQFSSIPDYELTEEELAKPEAEREAAARLLVLGSVYALNKQAVSQNVNSCVSVIQEDVNQRAAALQGKIRVLWAVAWTVTATILAVLIAFIVTQFTQVFRPLGNFVKMLHAGKPLDETRGFREVRLVAAAYNSTAKRRDALDNILRTAAETDALTNLPNRYRFEQFILEAEESGYSVAMLLFDVNYLKTTNDTLGHLAGDQLLINAAKCIARCFGDNCFRFGGDEFAAIITGCTPESVEDMILRFQEAEKENNVSISFGYAYTDEIGKTDFKQLLSEADKKMYANKEQMHARS